VHCAAGVHRAPMMTLAVMCALEWEIEEAMTLIETRRPGWWTSRTCMWKACGVLGGAGGEVGKVRGSRSD